MPEIAKQVSESANNESIWNEINALCRDAKFAKAALDDVGHNIEQLLFLAKQSEAHLKQIINALAVDRAMDLSNPNCDDPMAAKSNCGIKDTSSSRFPYHFPVAKTLPITLNLEKILDRPVANKH